MAPTTPEQKPTLEDRYRAFKCYELPGQPMAAHMGTIYLVTDLYKEVTSLTKERDDLKAIVADKIETIALYRVEMLGACKERDALAADAARYRFIAAHIADEGDMDVLERAFESLGESDTCTQAGLDACIDAAIVKEQRQAGVQ